MRLKAYQRRDQTLDQHNHFRLLPSNPRNRSDSSHGTVYGPQASASWLLYFLGHSGRRSIIKGLLRFVMKPRREISQEVVLAADTARSDFDYILVSAASALEVSRSVKC